jgi:3-isopropylmalate dehydrogenase
MILSLGMALRYSLQDNGSAERVERAVKKTLADGIRTADIAAGGKAVPTSAMGDAVVARL